MLKGKIGRKIENNGRANLKGDSCEYIDLAKIMSVDGCETGEESLIEKVDIRIVGRQEVCDWPSIQKDPEAISYRGGENHPCFCK